MIPYVHLPEMSLGPFVVGAPSASTAVGIFVALWFARRRARRSCLDLRQLNSLALWLVIGAVIGGHLSYDFAYHSEQVIEVTDGVVSWSDPVELLRVWDGWRSVGGALGGLCGALLWSTYSFRQTILFRIPWIGELEGYWFVRRQRRLRLVALADVLLCVFPIAWAFDRAGIALAHALPGARAPQDSLLAVAYPAPFGTGHGLAGLSGVAPRYDLGMLELGVTLLLLLVVCANWRKNLRGGAFIALVGVIYAPARFALDFWCAKTGPLVDPHFARLTPAQWGFGGLALLSAAMLVWVWKQPHEPTTAL